MMSFKIAHETTYSDMLHDFMRYLEGYNALFRTTYCGISADFSRIVHSFIHCSSFTNPQAMHRLTPKMMKG